MLGRKLMTRGALLFLTLLILGGCGDSNIFSGIADSDTPEAKRDLGIAALSTGDWSLAVELLEDLYLSNPDDADLKKYLASAYIGLSGFDTLDLITQIAEAQESDTQGSILFNAVLGIFSDDEGNLGDMDEKITLIAKGIDVLAPNQDDFESLSGQQKVQAGLYASVQTILITTRILEVQTTGALDALQDEEIAGLVQKNFSAAKDDLERSLTLVTVARDELIDSYSVDNDVALEFDIFIEEIGFGDGELEEDDLIQYLLLTL